MMCVLTHRRLKPGSWEQFRAGWEPEAWRPRLERAYHLRSVDDPNEVISFGFFAGGAEEMAALRESPEFVRAEDERLERIAPFEEATLFGGVFEVVEEITPGA